MSTLKVNTVQHNTSGFNNVVQFTDGAGTQNAVLCRAWVNFNGTGTVAIRADFNVSSITDNGTGDYTVNFSNAMTDANFAAPATTSNGNGVRFSFISIAGPTGQSSSSIRYVCYGDDAAIRDQNPVMVSVFR